jgi:hypothetical protein
MSLFGLAFGFVLFFFVRSSAARAPRTGSGAPSRLPHASRSESVDRRGRQSIMFFQKSGCHFLEKHDAKQKARAAF